MIYCWWCGRKKKTTQCRLRYCRRKMIEPQLTVSDGSVSPCIGIDKSHIDAIAYEYLAAKEKHPKFCDEIIPPEFDFDEEEKRWKKWNDEATTHYACDLFNEEFYEALNAYEQGNKEHALQELAQCGAVILRMMETIEKENTND